MKSYTSSTGVLPLCQPGSEDIASRIHIPVVDNAAQALPFADVERQLFVQGPAVRAHSGRRVPAVHHEDVAPIPVGLVFEHGAQLRPREARFAKVRPLLSDDLTPSESLAERIIGELIGRPFSMDEVR